MKLIILIIIIIIIIIIVRHELDLDGPVSASSNSLFKGLPSRLRRFSLQFIIISGILLLFTLVTCRSHFGLYLLMFSSTGVTVNSSKISSFFVVKKGVPGCSSEKFHFD